MNGSPTKTPTLGPTPNETNDRGHNHIDGGEGFQVVAIAWRVEYSRTLAFPESAAVTATHMTHSLQTPRVKEALSRIRSLFMDTGARLTTADAAQLAGLDTQVCGVLLQNLVETGFLEQRLRGVFVRNSSASHQA